MFFVPIAGSVGVAAWLCSLGLAAWHRPLDTAWWRVAAQGLLTGVLVSFVAGALYSLGGLPSGPLIVLTAVSSSIEGPTARPSIPLPTAGVDGFSLRSFQGC